MKPVNYNIIFYLLLLLYNIVGYIEQNNYWIVLLLITIANIIVYSFVFKMKITNVNLTF